MQQRSEGLPGERAIFESGLRLGDMIRLRPFNHKSRSITIGRTRVVIEKSTDGALIINPQSWSLGGPMASDGFELILDTSIEDGRFILSSLGRSFFLHNGTPTWRSYLLRGDRVDIGYNRLELIVPSTDRDVIEGLSPAVLDSDLSVLLTGETGTGKTRLAKMIHDQGKRRGKFVHLNLSAIPESLVASELFGHMKGAFTGAIYSKPGAVEEANEGTLFLDEVDSLSFDLQVKLLLFLDNKKFRPVGANFEKTSSPRLIFASGQDLNDLVVRQKMRHDFFYRISCGFSFNLAPLRSDVRAIKRFAQEWATRQNVTLSQQLELYLQSKTWPGNYRQLIGFLERKRALTSASYLCVAESDEECFGSDLKRPRNLETNIMTLDELKSNYARKIYRRLGSNLKLTARTLDISPNTLRKFLVDQNLLAAA